MKRTTNAQQLGEIDPPSGTAVDPEGIRSSARSETRLESIVQVKEGSGGSWKEITEVTTVSRNGASFTVSKPCVVGRLLTLVLPLPANMRAYDQNEKLYPVLGLVQHCHESVVDGEKRYAVGVAFVGKKVPASYKADPMQNYRITGVSADGLWTIAERDGQFQVRRHPRFWTELEVTLIVLQRERTAPYKETATTQNIGLSGASVYSSLDADVGDKVKFVCNDYDFFAISVVRQRKESNDPVRPVTLHLEFVDAAFPVDNLPDVQSFAIPSEPWDQDVLTGFK